MIPFFQYNAILFGPITIQVWGLWVAVGLVLGTVLFTYLAKKYLLSAEIALDLIIWAVLAGFIGARFFHVVFYEPAFYAANPGEILAFWHGGMSSLGGFFGAGVAVWLFAKKRRFSWVELMPYFDIGILSFWLAWAIGRLGCFFIHDHPGSLSQFFFAVNFPGGARHDLGLYDSLLAGLLFCFFALVFKRLIKIRWGMVAGLSIAAYAVARFWLDFLRATDLPVSDARYAELTPAQWGMAAIIFALIFMKFYARVGRFVANKRI